MTTGKRIQLARKNAGLTQKALGEKLGLSYQSIAQWENDLRNPKFGTLQRIADVLNIELNELLPPVDVTSFSSPLSSVCANLRTCRKQHNMSRKELAEITHIPIEIIEDYENKYELNPISNEHLQILSTVFGIQPEELLGGNLTSEKMAELYVSSLRAEIDEILNQFNVAGLQKAKERLGEMATFEKYKNM